MAYYYTGRSGDSYLDATIHDDGDCDELDDPARPIAETSIDEHTVEWCDDCGLKSDGNGNDWPAHCEAVKSDGELCGRELPCRYHS